VSVGVPQMCNGYAMSVAGAGSFILPRNSYCDRDGKDPPPPIFCAVPVGKFHGPVESRRFEPLMTALEGQCSRADIYFFL
jgi:hypothetical protein